MNVDDVLVSKSSGLCITIFRTFKAFTLVLIFLYHFQKSFYPLSKKIFEMAYQIIENLKKKLIAKKNHLLHAIC